MINPKTIMKVFGERKTFIHNHPELLWFILDNFGSEIPEGSQIELMVHKVGNDQKTICIDIKESDKQFLNAVMDVIEQVKS